MTKVNASFPRPYFPGTSRPKFQRLELSHDQIKRLRDLYFDSDGSLSDSIRKDVDSSAKHGFINFNNPACRTRFDSRWQVPIRKHGCVSLVPTRNTTEQVLRDVIDREVETLYDLGILVGGTEDQSLHHDTARQIITWMPEDKKMPVMGWEIDRLEYNAAMSSRNAPASILLGMNEKTEALLGVQKDQIIRCDGETKNCQIIGGKGEIYEIVRENKSLVVIKANNAIMFTGDFPHAGVRNISKGTPEDEMMTKLYKKIQSAIDELHQDDLVGQSRAVLDVLCNTPGLIRICRLHCSTEMLTGNMRIPVNTVGFSECVPNPLDARCVEADDEEDSDDEMLGNDEHLALEEDFLSNLPEDQSIPTLCESDGLSPHTYGSYS